MISTVKRKLSEIEDDKNNFKKELRNRNSYILTLKCETEIRCTFLRIGVKVLTQILLQLYEFDNKDDGKFLRRHISFGIKNKKEKTTKLTS